MSGGREEGWMEERGRRRGEGGRERERRGGGWKNRGGMERLDGGGGIGVGGGGWKREGEEEERVDEWMKVDGGWRR